MEQPDREKYAEAYRALADILDRDRPASRQERHMSFLLGDLARRVFLGTQFDPPDDLLEQVARIIRRGQPAELKHMARRLRDNAQFLEQWEQHHPAENE